MEANGIPFFCNDDEQPTAVYRAANNPLSHYPIGLTICEDYQIWDSNITIFFVDERQFIEFVNSVKSAYEWYRREKGYQK